MKLAEQWEILSKAQTQIPVPVMDLPRRLNIDYVEAYLGSDISGMLEKDGASFLITLNARDSSTRKRFTLAHEIGHFMLHRHLIGQGVDDDRAYRSTKIGKYHNTLIGPKEETEANKFAANLLMPRRAINKQRLECNNNVHDLAKLFEVSPQAMSIRLGVNV